MNRNDFDHHVSKEDTGTGSSPRQSRKHLPKTARADDLAAIMRDSTIVLDVPVYPLGKVYVEKSIRLDSPGTGPQRRKRQRADEGTVQP